MKVFADDDRSQVYMVMEWVDGRLLRQILIEQKQAADRARRPHRARHSARRCEYIHSTAWCIAI